MSSIALWDRFQDKAVALGTTVVYAADETRLGTPPDEDAMFRADFAIAESGSVVVCLSNQDRARALLAERLCLMVQRQDIVATLDEALQRVGSAIAERENRYVMFMSGPSRTADIERTLTIGVHGPRELAVAVIGETPL